MRIKVIKDMQKYQGDYLAEGYTDENGDFIEHKPIANVHELQFAIFCIEGFARYMGLSPKKVYKAFTQMQSDTSTLLDSYITPSSELLMTQSESYILSELSSAIKNWRLKFDV